MIRLSLYSGEFLSNLPSFIIVNLLSLRTFVIFINPLYCRSSREIKILASGSFLQKFNISEQSSTFCLISTIRCLLKDSIILSAKNLLDPASGNPIVGPSQDMILGINYLTRIQPGVKGENKVFKDVNEVMIACDVGAIHMQAKIKVKIEDAYVETSGGRVILNDYLPEGIPFINEPLNDKAVNRIIAKVYKEMGGGITVRMLDAIKDVGFKYAMVFGATIGMEDIIVPAEKKTIVDRSQKKADELYEEYRKGIISAEERYNKIQDIWTRASNEVATALIETLKKDRNGFNPVYMMADSGARGSTTQMRQLAGMRGLMAKPGGDIIELPIKSNFYEGLSVIEFFISTNGARKGLADTALKIAKLNEKDKHFKGFVKKEKYWRK